MSEVIEHDNGIAIPEETKKGMIAMGEVEKGLAKLKEQYAVVPDANTDEGYDLAKTERKAIAAVRSEVNAAHKQGKAFYLEGGRKVDAMKKSILAAIEPMESARADAIKAVDDEKARLAQIEADKKQERIDEIQIRIDGIKNSVGAAMSLEACESYLARLDALDIAEFEEFQEAAQIHIDNARDGLTERRVQLVAQADEAKKLEEQKARQAEEQGRIDAQKEEQRKEDEARAKEQADFEKEKAEFAAAKLAEQNRKDEEANAWRTNMQSLIAGIVALPSKVNTLDDCIEARAQLRRYHWDTAGEFEAEATKAVADSTMAIDIREEEIKIENGKARAQAAKELEDARLLGIQQQKDREEQERIDAMAVEKEAAAEAQRIAAMQPELERVRAWLESLHVATLPVIESAELAEVMKVYDDAVGKMDEMLTALEMKKAA